MTETSRKTTSTQTSNITTPRIIRIIKHQTTLKKQITRTPDTEVLHRALKAQQSYYYGDVFGVDSRDIQRLQFAFGDEILKSQQKYAAIFDGRGKIREGNLLEFKNSHRKSIP